MLQRLHHLLIFWLLIALQAMTPFIHAHANVLPAAHAGGLHMHPHSYSDVRGQTASSDGHGPRIEVAQGVPFRHLALAVADTDPAQVSPRRLSLATVNRSDTGLPAGLPRVPLPPPAHARPLALAPPLH